MPNDLDRVLRVEVPIIVSLGSRQMPLHDVVRLIPGSIIELPKQADEDLDILANNKQIGSGEAVKVGENFGVRVHFIGNLRERLEALAGERSSREPASDPAADEAAALAEAMLAGQV